MNRWKNYVERREKKKENKTDKPTVRKLIKEVATKQILYLFINLVKL